MDTLVHLRKYHAIALLAMIIVDMSYSNGIEKVWKKVLLFSNFYCSGEAGLYFSDDDGIGNVTFMETF